MCGKLNTLFRLFTLLLLVVEICSKFEFTNVECTSLDTKFDDFEYCFLKSINRTYKYVSLKVNLFKTPVTKVKVNVSLFKRYNGYRPFMYNITFDACRFLTNIKSNPLASYYYDFIRPFSNINHTCPFDNDLIVDKLTVGSVNHQFTNVLPFPNGAYMVETHWIAYDIDRAVVKVLNDHISKYLYNFMWIRNGLCILTKKIINRRSLGYYLNRGNNNVPTKHS